MKMQLWFSWGSFSCFQLFPALGFLFEACFVLAAMAMCSHKGLVLLGKWMHVDWQVLTNTINAIHEIFLWLGGCQSMVSFQPLPGVPLSAGAELPLLNMVFACGSRDARDQLWHRSPVSSGCS